MKKMETIVPIENLDQEVKAASKSSKAVNQTKPVHVSAFICSAIIHYAASLDKKKTIHSIKVGLALAVVSLLFVVQPLYEQVGNNAMWAVMTVVVVFEFSAGATLSKGLNRGMGTIAGGALGCLAAFSARQISHVTRAIAICVLVFVVGAAATYTRLVPTIKRKYDYGVMIFVLTFNLVAVYGFREPEIIQLGCDRLLTIVIGFGVCILICLFFFPIWAGDELHLSIANKFDKLAVAIEECSEDYFGSDGEASTAANNLNACTSVLYSKASDETLANFARWEPWHGKFGFSYPWDKYLKTGDLLRELAACIFTLKGICIHSHERKRYPHPSLTMAVKEPCTSLGNLLKFTLMELGHSFSNMKRSDHTKKSTLARLNSLRGEVRSVVAGSLTFKVQTQNGMMENGATMSFVFGMLNIADMVERLIKEVENLEKLAGFVSE